MPPVSPVHHGINLRIDRTGFALDFDHGLSAVRFADTLRDIPAGHVLLGSESSSRPGASTLWFGAPIASLAAGLSYRPAAAPVDIAAGIGATPAAIIEAIGAVLRASAEADVGPVLVIGVGRRHEGYSAIRLGLVGETGS